jgi:hypothetical protein
MPLPPEETLAGGDDTPLYAWEIRLADGTSMYAESEHNLAAEFERLQRRSWWNRLRGQRTWHATEGVSILLHLVVGVSPAQFHAPDVDDHEHHFISGFAPLDPIAVDDEEDFDDEPREHDDD